MRAYRLALLALAVAGAAHAAPAPFRPAEPAPAEVNLSGYLRSQSQAPGAPMVLASRAAYLRVAEAWGIANPPAVDFRTHFIVAFASEGLGGFDFEQDGRGGLRVVEQPLREKSGPLLLQTRSQDGQRRGGAEQVSCPVLSCATGRAKQRPDRRAPSLG